MFVSTVSTAVTTTSSPPKTTFSFDIDPVTGRFTAGQTITVTASGLVLPGVPVPFQLELSDEKGTQIPFSTSLQFKPTDSPQLFSLVIPIALR